MKVHYGMPLRVMLYDGLGYLKEYQDLSRKNKQEGVKISAAELLSGIRKSDRLHPIISIVVYYGEDPWDGPFSLRDMITEMPEEIAKVFSDYQMNLMQVRESIEQRTKEIVIRMLRSGADDAFIQEITELKAEEIEKLRQTMQM